MMKVNYNNVYYPPGGILLWIIVFLELITFTVGIAFFLSAKEQSMESFQNSQLLLHTWLGAINTIVLVTGGYMMAESLRLLKKGNNAASYRWLMWSIFMAAAFLLIKGYEYYEKVLAGYNLDYSEFFTFYWMLTGFHFIHVVIAVIILLVLARGIKRGTYGKRKHLDVESGAIFWHMCDLIWIMLYPVLYLML